MFFTARFYIQKKKMFPFPILQKATDSSAPASFKGLAIDLSQEPGLREGARQQLRGGSALGN